MGRMSKVYLSVIVRVDEKSNMLAELNGRKKLVIMETLKVCFNRLFRLIEENRVVIRLVNLELLTISSCNRPLDMITLLQVQVRVYKKPNRGRRFKTIRDHAIRPL
jgi:hypothetical protein